MNKKLRWGLVSLATMAAAVAAAPMFLSSSEDATPSAPQAEQSSATTTKAETPRLVSFTQFHEKGYVHVMLAPGTELTEEDFVVADPDWRWPNPNGNNPPKGDPIEITYSYSNMVDIPGGLSCNQVREVVEESLGLWSTYAPLNFVELEDAGPCPADVSNDTVSPNLRIGHHFIDGPGGVLAHAYFPYSSTDGLAGDVHFDGGDDWDNQPGGGSFDLLEVCLHELGHSLGLGHEPSPPDGNEAIMNPFYGGRFDGPGTAFLLDDDINGIRDIYGTGNGSVTPLTGGGCGEACDETCPLETALNSTLRGAKRVLGGGPPEPIADSSDQLQRYAQVMAALSTVRQFRDRALNQTTEGRELVRAYYEHSTEMTLLMARNPKLAAEALGQVGQLLPALERASQGQPVTIDRDAYAAGLKLIDAYAASAGEELQQTLRQARQFIESRARETVTGVEIDFSLETVGSAL